MKALKFILSAVFVVAGLLYINTALIPQPKQTEAETHQWGNYDTCGDVYITASDLSCPTGANSYGTTATLSIQNKNYTGTHRVHYVWYSFFCTTPGFPDEGGKSCIERRIKHDGYVDVSNAHNHVNITVPQSDPATFASVDPSVADYKACGAYQNDFFILDIDGQNSCHYGTFDYSGQNNWVTLLAGVCKTGVQCTKPVTHNECQNNACVKVNGKGTDQCQLGDNSACQPQTHFACQNFACVKVAGPGANQCRAEEINSPDCSHLTCVNNACTRVNGVGSDTCTIGGTECQPPQTHLTVVKVVNNNHGGTKQPGDFTLRVNGTQVTTGTSNLENPGDYTVSEDSMDGYHQVSISGDCDNSGHVHLNTGDNKTCIIENEDNGSSSCQMPTCNTTIPGCSFPSPDTTTCSCGPMVCITQTPPQNNITVNVSQQQQQQQEVLAASVAPAVQTSELPKTGAGAEVLLSLLGLLPIGWKLKKFV